MTMPELQHEVSFICDGKHFTGMWVCVTDPTPGADWFNFKELNIQSYTHINVQMHMDLHLSKYSLCFFSCTHTWRHGVACDLVVKGNHNLT